MGDTGVTTTVSIQRDLIAVHVGVETTDCSPVVDVKVQLYTLTVLYDNTQWSSSLPLVHSGLLTTFSTQWSSSPPLLHSGPLSSPPLVHSGPPYHL